MRDDDNLQIQYEKPRLAFSPVFQISFIMLSFIALIFSRILTQSFDVFLDSLYILCIALTGFWFGLRGGLLAALLSTVIFVLEINIFQDFPAIDLAIRTMVPRFILYFFAGTGLGYFSDKEHLLKKQLERLARYDYLTSCFNLRYTLELLEKEIQRSRRYGQNLAIAMLDIDYFKNINDTYGHLVGNEVIKIIGTIIKKNLRRVDMVGRYGGDEFLAIFPEMQSKNASHALRRIAGELSTIKFTSPYSKRQIEIPIKFSAGVVSYPENGRNTEELLSMADFAVYKAKKKGRSCIVIEKRKWLRFEPTQGLEIEITASGSKNPFKPIKIINVSQNGMKFLIDRDITSDTFSSKILFTGENPSGNILCKVRYKTKIKGDLWQIGMYFDNIDEHTQERLLDYSRKSSEIDKI